MDVMHRNHILTDAPPSNLRLLDRGVAVTSSFLPQCWPGCKYPPKGCVGGNGSEFDDGWAIGAPWAACC